MDSSQETNKLFKHQVPKYGTSQMMEKAITKLRTLLSEDSISIEHSDLKKHGYSEWGTGLANIPQLPLAVVYPKSTAEVSEIAKICTEFRVPMIPYSGGSSLEGHFTAPYGGLSVAFKNMNQVIQIFEDDMDATVQPGVNWVDLNEKLASKGLFFPVDPGTTAQFGGMVGTNCSGTNAVRYGAMKEWVVNLTMVLSNGSIIKTKKRPHKSSAGYNLNGLIVGSEGTLGLITEITIKLAPIPQHFSVATVSFPTILNAASAATSIIKAGIPIAAMELLDEVTMNIINRVGSTAPKVWEELPTMFLKFSGSETSIKDNIAQVEDIAKIHESSKFEFAKDAAEQELFWSARKKALESMHVLKDKDTVLWITDVAVPMSKLAEIIAISKKEMVQLGLFSALIGHLGDGNFHQAFSYNPQSSEDLAAVKTVIDKMIDRVLEMDGTCTGEHGVGWSKKEHLMKELGSDTIDVMKTIKGSLDPLWLMNPGKIFDLPIQESE